MRNFTVKDIEALQQKYSYSHLPNPQSSTLPEEACRYFGWFERSSGRNISEINILDLGCGNGNFMCIMNELGAKSVHGIEINFKFAELAKEQLIKNSFLPNVIMGDYFNGFTGINLRIPNLLFHLYAYEGIVDNRLPVFEECFLKFSKKGDYFLVHPGFIRDKQFYESRSVKQIFQEKHGLATLIQKF